MPAKLNADKTRAALHSASRISVQMLLLLLMAGVVLWLVGKTWPVVWPLLIALLITTLTWPLNAFLRRHGWRPALAAAAVMVLFLLIAAGTVVLIVVPVASQSGDLADGVAN